MGCHREIPKQRAIDLPKACSRLFVVSIKKKQRIIKIKTQGLVALLIAEVYL
jgi:hypothetical protein